MALTEKLTAIADAIREKTNTTEKITLAKMPEMISSITGGKLSFLRTREWYEEATSL